MQELVAEEMKVSFFNVKLTFHREEYLPEPITS